MADKYPARPGWQTPDPKKEMCQSPNPNRRHWLAHPNSALVGKPVCSRCFSFCVSGASFCCDDLRQSLALGPCGPNPLALRMLQHSNESLLELAALNPLVGTMLYNMCCFTQHTMNS